LRRCSLEVVRGECVGVMGPNGSGKSTLLQMVAGVTAPSEGAVSVEGRIAPLVQVGVGFHPELTGRENVYINGTILGLTRRQIDERFDSIVEFSELADFIDTPVKFYSSGMYVRLGFGVAVAADPDILLVDEILAVGDIAFQRKCFAKMEEIRGRGTTMIVVSHNVQQIRRSCPRSVVLHDGNVVFDGPTADAVSAYYESLGKRMVSVSPSNIYDQTALAIAELELLDEVGRPTRQVDVGDALRIRLSTRLRNNIEDIGVYLVLSTIGGDDIYREYFGSLVGHGQSGGCLDFELRMPVLLTTGTYQVEAGIITKGIPVPLAMSQPVTFHVSGRDFVLGVADLGAT